MSTQRRAWSGLSIMLVSLCARPVSATYSIAGTDAATQQVGGAVTSCVGSLDLASAYGSVPGKGVIHAQAQLDRMFRGKNRALMLLEQGVAPEAIIAEITASTLDSGFASRQYGVVDVQGRAAGFTGARAQAYKEDRHAKVGSFAYSVQGNILTSGRVLDQAAAAFEAGGCDLADRLMAALEAGGANGEGDSRCTRSGIPSDAAFIQVDLPGQPAGSYLRLRVSNTGPDNPLPRLRAMFDTWRKTHPCAAGGQGAAGTGISAGAGAGGVAGMGSAGVPPGSTSGAGSSGAGPAVTGMGGSGSGGAGKSGSGGVSGLGGALASGSGGVAARGAGGAGSASLAGIGGANVGVPMSGSIASASSSSGSCGDGINMDSRGAAGPTRGTACGAISASGSRSAGSPAAAVSGEPSASSEGCTVPELGRSRDRAAVPAAILLLAAVILRSRRRPRV